MRLFLLELFAVLFESVEMTLQVLVVGFEGGNLMLQIRLDPLMPGDGLVESVLGVFQFCPLGLDDLLEIRTLLA